MGWPTPARSRSGSATCSAPPGYDELLGAAAAAGPGARGLLMLPYFAGERTPIADPDARGVIAGLTLGHGRGDLYRAALEATAFGVRHNVETMWAAGATIDPIVAVGGGTTGGLWTQIVSDVTAAEQDVPETTVGRATEGRSWPRAPLPTSRSRTGTRCANGCCPTRAYGSYDELYATYRDLYPATREIVQRLAGSGGR